MWVWSVLLLVACAQARERLDPLVDTKQGLIRGLRADDGDYSMFLGIPYGKVPEDNPFGAAEPHPPFDGVFEAYDDTAICPQVENHHRTIVGSLDCLHLSVHVPNKANSRNRLPVLVWIHGGGTVSGFHGRSLYGSKFLVRHDVIFVSLNYRLGPYGFMCLDTPEVPGNQGLKDQALALRWIRDNIEEFGGDVNKITVFGESAGGESVEYHLLSNHEKLFHQAILQSGSANAARTVTESDRTVPLRLAAQLGYETDNIDEALELLKNTDVKLVIAAGRDISLNVRVCVEKEFDGVESFLTEHPVNIDRVAKAKDMNIISGYNDHESLMTYLDKPDEFYVGLDPFNNLLSVPFKLDKLLGNGIAYARRFYIGDNAISNEVRWQLTDFQSDTQFMHPIQTSVERFLRSEAKNVFHYVFSYTGERNYLKKRRNVTVGGAAHADELGYLFDMNVLDEEINEADQLIVDRFTTLWTNFVKYGNPTPEATDLLPISWPAATASSLNYLNIDTHMRVGTRPFNERMTFWDLFYDANREALKGLN